MMRFTKIAAMCAGVSILANCTALTTTKVAERPIDNSYELDGIKWQGSGGLLVFMFKTFETNGMVELCGGYTFDKDERFNAFSWNDLAIPRARIELDGSTLVSDLGYFNKVAFPSSKDDLTGTASCVLTKRPWSDSTPVFEYNSGTIRLYD